MGSEITRRKFFKVSASAAGLAAGSVLLAGCTTTSAASTSASTASASISAAASSAAAASASSGSIGHHGKGAPMFQRAMNKATKVDTAPDEAEALAKFVVVSDSHLSFTYTAYIDRIQNMFEDIAEFCPDNDAIIVNGDITNTGSQEEYDKFAELAEASGFTYPDDFVLVIGNHDQYDSSDGSRGPGNLTDLFRQQAGISDQIHPYYDRTINGVHLIMMGPDHYPDTAWDKFGVSSGEIEWLDELRPTDPNDIFRKAKKTENDTGKGRRRGRRK